MQTAVTKNVSAHLPINPSRVGAVLFDLSEVLINGLIGVEKYLSPPAGISPADVEIALTKDPLLKDMFRGQLGEDAYLQRVYAGRSWILDSPAVKSAIRKNFEVEVPGTVALAERLASRYELILVSDHGSEWVEYILGHHRFLSLFGQKFFSYQLGALKREPGTLGRVLAAAGLSAAEVVYVDDMAKNIEAANLAGIPGIRFENAVQLERLLFANHLIEAPVS